MIMVLGPHKKKAEAKAEVKAAKAERAAEREAEAEAEQRELRELRERHAAAPREERPRRVSENLEEV
jgi:translation initiation factor IF-3